MSHFEVVSRSQYTFYATDKQVACLLTANVKKDNPTIVNVVAVSSMKIKKNKNLVKIIVGTDNPNDPRTGGAGDPTNPDPLRTNKLQNKQFQKNLKKYEIDYTKDEVIQILNVEKITGTPGIYRIFLASLVCEGISIDAFYIGEYALTIPLVTCGCSDNTTQFKSEIVSAIIQVPQRKLEKAINILTGIDLTAPFDEDQLCINAINVEEKCLNNFHCRCNNK